MRKQMIGFAWILFGILLSLMGWDYMGAVRYGSLLCGLIGLVTVIIYSGPDDGEK